MAEPGGAVAPETEHDASSAPEIAVDPELVQHALPVSDPGPLQLAKWRRLRADWLATRYPLIGISVLLLLITIPQVTASVVRVVVTFPTGGTVALVVWAAYAFPLIWLVNRFDFFEREPTTLLAMGLVWGGVIASSLAVTANQAVFSLFTSLFGEDFTQQWGPALAAPTTEELLKSIGILAVILLAMRGVRSAIDGFVVGAMVGIGFQVVENFVYTGNLLVSSVQAGSELRTVLDVFLVRGLGAGLWSHAVYSGVVGLGLGYAFTRHDRGRGQRIAVALATLGLAWVMHFVWNLPPLVTGSGPLVAVLKGLSILAVLAVIVLRAQRRESHIYTEYLEALDDPHLASLEEIQQLRTYRSREAAVAEAGQHGGEKVADAVRELQRSQADLSVALATGDVAEIEAQKRQIELIRVRRAKAELLPPDLGYGWGVASIWLSIVGVLIPVIGPLIAALLAWIGTNLARSKGAGTASTLRAAWPAAGLSLVVGLVLLLVI